jgi:hypothetical protein
MLLSISLIFGMLIAWLVLTAILICLWIYRAGISLREEGVLFIDPGEDKLLQEQQAITTKIDRLRPVLIVNVVVVVLLGLGTLGLWIYQQLQ